MYSVFGLDAGVGVGVGYKVFPSGYHGLSQTSALVDLNIPVYSDDRCMVHTVCSDQNERTGFRNKSLFPAFYMLI